MHPNITPMRTLLKKGEEAVANFKSQLEKVIASAEKARYYPLSSEELLNHIHEIDQYAQILPPEVQQQLTEMLQPLKDRYTPNAQARVYAWDGFVVDVLYLKLVRNDRK